MTAGDAMQLTWETRPSKEAGGLRYRPPMPNKIGLLLMNKGLYSGTVKLPWGFGRS